MSSQIRPVGPPFIESGGCGAIEALRTLGLLMLAAYHVALLAPWFDQSMLTLALQRVAASGWIGTDLLLAIGGFLCVASLSRAESYSAWLGRRALRILPAYWVWLVFYLYAVPRILQSFGVNPSDAAGYEWLDAARSHQVVLWTMTTNLLFATGTHIGASLEPMLTIAIGVQLGLLTSIVQRLRGGRYLPGFALALIAVGIGLRLVWMAQISTHPWLIYSFPLTRCDAFAFGVLFAALLSDPSAAPRVRRIAPKLGWIAIVAIVAVFAITAGLRVTAHLTQELAYPVVGFAAAVLVLVASQRKVAARPAATRFIAGLLAGAGAWTYGMYLVKLPLLYALRGLLERIDVEPSIAVLLAVGIPTTVFGGWCWYRAVERPLRHLGPGGQPS